MIRPPAGHFFSGTTQIDPGILLRSHPHDLLPGLVQDQGIVSSATYRQAQVADNRLAELGPVLYLLCIQQHGNGLKLELRADGGGFIQAMKPETVKRPGIAEYLPGQQPVEGTGDLGNRSAFTLESVPGYAVDPLGAF